MEITTVKRKSAAATWLQWTLGGIVVGLTTFGIVTRRFRGDRLVIQKSPQKFKMGKSLTHW